MKDYCIRAITTCGEIRAFAARSTDLCEEARKRHDTYPVATAALGRVLTIASIMGIDLQSKHLLTIRVLGDGPLKSIVAVAESGGNVRGYVGEPHAHLPSKSPGKLNVGEAVGKGYLHVTKDLGMGEPYTGSVPLISGEIADDFTRYFFESEQIPSAISLGVLVETDNHVRAAGGYVIQLLPGASEETIKQMEKNISTIEPISTMIDAGMSPEEILQTVLAGFEVKILSQHDIMFKCSCSEERVQKALISMGAEELEDMLLKDKGAQLICHFCNEVYQYDEHELRKIYEDAK